MIMTGTIEFGGDGDRGFSASNRYQEIKTAAYEHLLSRIEELGAEFGRWARTAIQEFVDIEVASFVRLRRVPINEGEMRQISEALTKELAGLGPLEDLLADPAVEDILINGYDNVFVSRRGVLARETLRFTDNQHVLRIVRRILAPMGRRLDESTPMVDARLPDGGRLNVVIEPLAVDGPMVSIRKFRQDPLKPADLLTLGTFDEEIYRLLSEAVKHRCNILVSGGTSSGKTSLLNALAFFIPETERVVTVEDTAELSLNHPHVVRLEARQGGFDGSGAVTIRELIRNSLRMRPDRVVVGEVRGAEVMDMLQAMNTGHEGSMATIHANSPRECLYRIEMLAGFAGFQGSEDSLRRQIASALDFIVQIGRLSNGKRRVLSVTEVTGMGDNVISTQELYRHESFATPEGEEKDRWNWLGIHPHTPKLAKMRHEARQSDGGAPEPTAGRRVLEPEALMQQALVLAALALVLAVAAVLLWRHANSGAPPAVPPSWKTSCGARARADRRATFAGGARARSGFSWWDRLLLLAGLRHGAGLYLRIFAPIVAARCWPGPFGRLVRLRHAAAPDRRRLFPAVAARRQAPAPHDLAIAGLPGQHGPAHHHRQQHGLGLPDRRRQRRRAAARSGRDRRRPEPLGQGTGRGAGTCRASTG